MGGMMIRKQISIEVEQDSALKREAARRGVSEAAVIREAIDALLARAQGSAWAEASTAIGSVNSGLGDLAENHDFYLYGPDTRDASA